MNDWLVQKKWIWYTSIYNVNARVLNIYVPQKFISSFFHWHISKLILNFLKKMTKMIWLRAQYKRNATSVKYCYRFLEYMHWYFFWKKNKIHTKYFQYLPYPLSKNIILDLGFTPNGWLQQRVISVKENSFDFSSLSVTKIKIYK